MKFIQNNFLSLIILVLVGLVFIERCSQKLQPPAQPVIVRDTVWVDHAGTNTTVPSIINSIPYPVDRLTKEIQYLPDTNYKRLLIQYQNLLSLYLVKNIQQDKLKIDSIGFVSITDTVTKNFISSRKFTYNLKYPTITTTITLPPKPVNQLYIGGGLQGSSASLINQFNAGLMLKNKKDQLYGIYVGVDTKLTPMIGVQSYWKINLRRK